jgi:hypothetical protein
MATRLKIEKMGDEIIPLEMHFFVDSLLLVTQIIKGKQLLLQNVKYEKQNFENH